jgi:hypothetical protein
MFSHMHEHWRLARGAISGTYPGGLLGIHKCMPACRFTVNLYVDSLSRPDLEAGAGTTLEGAAERTAASRFRF